MAEDSRKEFILATVGNHYGYSVSDGAVSHLRTAKELDCLLDDSNCQVLATKPELTQGVRLIQVCVSHSRTHTHTHTHTHTYTHTHMHTHTS